jgi:hypothetical protein
MLTLTDAIDKMAPRLLMLVNLAQDATYILIQADLSVSRAILIILAKPLAGAVSHLAARPRWRCRAAA